MKETINHPDHYKGNRFEAIDIIEDYELNFHLGNVVKYVLRAGKKGSKLEDLKKSQFYLKREIDLLELIEPEEELEAAVVFRTMRDGRVTDYTELERFADRLRDADEREMW